MGFRCMGGGDQIWFRVQVPLGMQIGFVPVPSERTEENAVVTELSL